MFKFGAIKRVWLCLVFTVLATLTLGGNMAASAQTSPPAAEASAQQARALFLKGKAFHDGAGRPRDFTKARIYYTKSANLGNNDARTNLGYLYFMGQGVTQNYSKARSWYLSAAKAGDKSSQLNLAMIYENGLGTKKDPALAAYWRGRAADKPVEPQPETAAPKPSPSAKAIKPTPKVIPAAKPARIAFHMIPNFSGLPITASLRPPMSIAAHSILTPTPKTITIAAARPVTVNFSQTSTPMPGIVSSAPTWISSILAALMLSLCLLSAVWFAQQMRSLKSRHMNRVFANAFYDTHRDSLRTNFLRYPEARRSIEKIDAPWSVALCVLMVKFAQKHASDTRGIGGQSRKILKALSISSIASRKAVFPLVPSLQPRILADIRAVDIAPKTASKPFTFYAPPH